MDLFVGSKCGGNYQNDGIGPFSDVQSRLRVRVDVILRDEALGGEAQEHARRPALAHLVPQHHQLKEAREELQHHSELLQPLLNYSQTELLPEHACILSKSE